ncbi:hypothetical protein AB0I99_12765 [Streptomyces spongiicola]|uniref:hypothetical protein n=1 Tax=Streptomyces spongiicola TaxID=1690221 RepID=UPI00340B1CA4
MKHDVAAASAARPKRGAAPGLLPRMGLATVPLASLGMLGALPSLVVAWRRGARSDWLTALLFTAATVGWWFQALLTPVETHGAQFGLDVALVTLVTVGAALHVLLVRRRPSAEPLDTVSEASAPAWAPAPTSSSASSSASASACASCSVSAPGPAPAPGPGPAPAPASASSSFSAPAGDRA